MFGYSYLLPFLLMIFFILVFIYFLPLYRFNIPKTEIKINIKHPKKLKVSNFWLGNINKCKTPLHIKSILAPFLAKFMHNSLSIPWLKYVRIEKT